MHYLPNNREQPWPCTETLEMRLVEIRSTTINIPMTMPLISDPLRHAHLAVWQEWRHQCSTKERGHLAGNIRPGRIELTGLSVPTRSVERISEASALAVVAAVPGIEAREPRRGRKNPRSTRTATLAIARLPKERNPRARYLRYLSGDTYCRGFYRRDV